jgi:hypothetical protein
MAWPEGAKPQPRTMLLPNTGQKAYDAWDEWESVLKGFVEGYGRDSLYELMALADPTHSRRG